MAHPAGLPDLFVDRSLGRIHVPALLRAAGFRLTTLAERYGIPADERVADEHWLRDAGERGEVVLMKDERIRYRPTEKAALLDAGVWAFCLARRDLNSAEMAALFMDNGARMVEACSESPSGLWVVTNRGLRKVPLTRPGP